jgi:hypothetical protein
MNDIASKFRIVIQARKGGRYGFVVTRTDEPNWAESSLKTFLSPEEAFAAGSVALERHMRTQP